MIYTLIISLLIEKPFYLLSPFSNFMSQGWGFSLPVLSRGEGFCTQWLSQGGLLPSCRVLGVCPREGKVMDEIDTDRQVQLTYYSKLNRETTCSLYILCNLSSNWVSKSLIELFLIMQDSNVYMYTELYGPNSYGAMHLIKTNSLKKAVSMSFRETSCSIFILVLPFIIPGQINRFIWEVLQAVWCCLA